MTTTPTPRPLTSGTAFTRRVDHSRQLTSENIQAHMDAFQAAGGRVEKLGTTEVLKRIASDADTKPKAG